MYQFQREDNDELVEVPFDEMMQMDALGCITLADGAVARRCKQFKNRTPKSVEPGTDAWNRPLVSDSMGFGQHQLAEFEADRVANNFTGIEFKPDPQTPEFIQVHCSSPGQWEKYIKHRGLVNKNGSISAQVHLSEDDFRRARVLVGGE